MIVAVSTLPPNPGPAMSLRALAKALGIGTASLYTYVPGKAELLELMVDRIDGTQPLPTADRGWRAGLRDLATSDLATFRAHPWLMSVATSRTVFGPMSLRATTPRWPSSTAAA